MIVWVFTILAIFGVCAAYLLRYWFSGKNLSVAGLYSCVVFNCFFAVPYIMIIEDNDFVFLGSRPDIILEHPSIGWIAFVCVFMHSFAVPTK